MQYRIDFRSAEPPAQENPTRKSGLYLIVRFWPFAILLKGFDLAYVGTIL